MVNPVFDQAMRQYWMHCGGLNGQPQYVQEVTRSAPEVSLFDFMQSFAACNSGLSGKKMVVLRSTNEPACGPIQMAVVNLKPVLVPDEARSQDRLTFRDLPNWFGTGVAMPVVAGSRVGVEFVLDMHSDGIASVYFDTCQEA